MCIHKSKTFSIVIGNSSVHCPCLALGGTLHTPSIDTFIFLTFVKVCTMIHECSDSVIHTPSKRLLMMAFGLIHKQTHQMQLITSEV